MKERIYNVIEKADEGDRASKWFDNVILVLILLTVVAIVLESFDSIAKDYSMVFKVFEAVSVSIFSVEYVLRVWTADIQYPEKSKLGARLRYMVSFMAIVDLIAILPFYIPMLLPVDLRVLRLLRMFRLFRVFKLNRYFIALNLIVTVMKKKKEELVATISIMLMLIVVSATLIYYMETDIQPEAFPNIVASFWWAIATLTTVGYGDVYPVTALGKLLASVIAVTGIGLVALPTGILSSGFMDAIKKDETVKCPHCGEDVPLE